MGLPTLAKTWQLAHTTVAPLGNGTTDLKRGLRTGIVDAFLAFGSGTPTVAGSSDSSTAGMDATNRWTDDTKLVWANAGVAHSWIVLTFGSNFHLCIDLSNSSVGSMTVVLSASAGFTGGSTTARPTATDEIVILNNAAWVNVTSDVQRVWHVWMPTDSSGLRVIMYQTNGMESWWYVTKPINTSTGWTNPLVGLVKFSSTLDGTATYGNLYTTGAGITGKGPGGAFTMGFTSEAISSAIGQLQTIVNGIDGGYPMMPIGLYSATVGSVGRHGSIQDLWWGSTFPNTGDFYPNDATRQFVQIGDLIYPWDGTASLVTA